MNLCAPYDARAVANFLLDLAQEINFPLTQVSLLKLIYFAHGWYLAENGRPLIKQDFEAWEHGPVVKVVRDEFKIFLDEPITSRAFQLDIYSGERFVVKPLLSESDARFVDAVFGHYHSYGTWRLSDLTHDPGSPWDVLWHSAEPVGRLALRMKNDEIRKYFAGIPRPFRLQ